MAGCADDLRNRSVFDCGAGNAVIRFSVDDVSLTRSGAEKDMETVVDHAYLLFYSEDACAETDIPLAAVKAEINTADAGQLEFKMPLRLEPNTDYQLLAIANADDYAPAGFDNFGGYLDAWCRSASQSDNNPLHLFSSLRISSANHNNLPMSGEVSGSSAFRFSIDNGTYNVSVSLLFRRLVARIDVANIVKEEFKVEGVALCNWRDAVPVTAFSNQLGNRLGMVRDILSSDNDLSEEGLFVRMPDADESGIQQLNNELYCFPSVSYDSYLGDKESTALIIKAKYGEDAESTYYRVNVGMKGNYAEVKPNTKYLVTIKSVQGSGAPTPKEAYSATESPIVLSVVEGWDLEGNAFDTDDSGNFLVLSHGSLEFGGDSTDNFEVRVLTSKGVLNWTAACLADDEASSSAFNVVKISDAAIAIAPNGTNDNEFTLTGKCRVTATTKKGTTLTVNISLRQEIAEEKPYDPVIPDDMPFALIPESYERVKIDHVNKTIEIDGFDPDCFNSFIDIPFKVYVNPSETNVSSLNISTTLEWPLEGRISFDLSSQYLYHKESFGVQRTVSNGKGEPISHSTLGISTLSVKNDDIIHVSVGAMGPDDPAIVREVILSVKNGQAVPYTLIVKPHSAIIDDVILMDTSNLTENSYWLIMDRNVQDVSAYENYIGLDSNGRRRQAYNYTYLQMTIYINSFSIPFKLCENNVPFIETKHDLYKGLTKSYNKNNPSTSFLKSSRSSWLKKYCESGNFSVLSPFYETMEGANNYENWIFPSTSVIKLWSQRLRVSKMRMFLVSDVPVKSKKNEIPVCCYLPYWCYEMGQTDTDTYGYFKADNGLDPNQVILVIFDNNGGLTVNGSTSKNYNGFTRLVRPLTDDELDNYKKNYLGYGTEPHKLTICHPDTWNSDGWLPY